MDELLGCVRRTGRVDGIVESAWALPLWQFHRVREAWLTAPVPDRPKMRRAA